MRSSRPCSRLALGLIMVGTVLATFSQATSSQLNHTTIRGEETRLYSEARPYLDESAPELEKRIRELKGLKQDSSQEQLSDLLVNVGMRLEELVVKVPDLTSDERVTQIQEVVNPVQSCAPHARALGNFPVDGCPPTSGPRVQENYHYIVLSHQTEDGRVLEELRTDGQNQVVEPDAGGPNFHGFVLSWVIFSPSNRPRSRFQYLGKQKIGKREAFVVAFAQIPGSVDVPVMMAKRERTIPICSRGSRGSIRRISGSFNSELTSSRRSQKSDCKSRPRRFYSGRLT